jgi:ubiquinone/menaquinone biosynthesis C-methylase UbiE
MPCEACVSFWVFGFPYPPDMSLEEAKQESKEAWDRVAPGWDKHNDYLWSITRGVGERLVELVAPQPGDTILDIAAGPGNVGFAAAALIGDEGRLISTDFADEMVDVARARAHTLGITNAEFKTMDAENMDLPDDHVDGVICRWGFMLMTDPGAALHETRRVLRPGGKLACSVWGGPADNPWVTLLGMVMTMRGRPPQGDPFGPGGMFSLSDHDTIRKLMADAGFEHVEIEEMPVAWTFPDFEAYWAYLSDLSGQLAALMAELPEEEMAEVEKDMRAQAENYRSENGFTFPGRTVNVVAS